MSPENVHHPRSANGVAHGKGQGHSTRRWGPFKSLLALSPVLVGGPWLAYWHHNSE